MRDIVATPNERKARPGAPRLILGADGGGSKTAARIASVDAGGFITLIGEGLSGPANVRAVAPVHGLANLDIAVDAALGMAEVDLP